MNDLLDIHFNKLRTSVLIFKQQFPVENITCLARFDSKCEASYYAICVWQASR